MNTILHPILFLDFDGVIRVPLPTATQPASIFATDNMDFNPVLMGNVRRFVEKNDMRIVLSTAWKNDGWKALSTIMDLKIPMKLLHRDYKTRDMGPRWCEIEDWLHRNGNPEYVILDDWALQFENCPDSMRARFVQCKFDRGFDLEKVAEAQEVLDKTLDTTYQANPDKYETKVLEAPTSL